MHMRRTNRISATRSLRKSPRFDAAAARALLGGAHIANTLSAEIATGYNWGDLELVPPEPRRGRRYLRKAGRE